LAALRFSLPLVWFATAASMAGYLVVLGYAKWYAPEGRNLRVERYQQLIFLVALALTGVVVGQVIRRARQLAEDYAAGLDSRRNAQPAAGDTAQPAVGDTAQPAARDTAQPAAGDTP